MQGIILAAGKGKRLQPVTPHRTKAMAPVAGKPMVERVVDTLVTQGIGQFVFLISPEDDKIVSHFTHNRPELAIRFVVQAERLGMGHALGLAAPFIEGDFLLSACDNLVPEAHIRELIATHERCEAQATLSLMAIDRARASSTGIVDWQDGWIRQIVEKPDPADAPSNISSLPLYLFRPTILEFLPTLQRSPRGEYELQDAIQLLINTYGRVTGALTPSRLQLTNVADLLALNRYYLVDGVDGTARIGAGTQVHAPVRIDTGVTIGENCEIGPNVYIERGGHIGDGVRLQESIVLRGARIADHSQHTDTVLL